LEIEKEISAAGFFLRPPLFKNLYVRIFLSLLRYNLLTRLLRLKRQKGYNIMREAECVEAMLQYFSACWPPQSHLEGKKIDIKHKAF